MKKKINIYTDDLVLSVIGNYRSEKDKWYINRIFANEYIKYHDISKHPFISLIDNYMNERYDDGVENIYELLYRLVNHIEEKPKCPSCGKPLQFYTTENRYKKFCDSYCVSNFNKDKVRECNKQRMDELRKDPIKWAKYVEKLSIAGKRTWKNKSDEQKKKESEETTKRNNKLWADPKHRKKRCDNMKKRWDERKARWSEEDKQKDHDMRSKRFRDAWKNKSEEEKEKCRQKQKDAWKNKSEEEKAAWWQNVIEAKEAKGIPLFPTRNSDQETEAYEYIKSLYPLTKRWYDEDPRYDRYECDIYVPEKDAFIECQFFKTHGKHPYDPNNPKDVEFADKLKNDTFCHKDYKTFTIRDPHKRKITTERNMNFYEMWNTTSKDYEGVTEWLHNLPEVTQEEIDKRIAIFTS